MKARHWWWMAALAGAVALAVPATRTLAQAPAGGEESYQATGDDPSSWGDVDDWGPGALAWQDDDGWGGGGPGMGMGMGRGMGRGMRAGRPGFGRGRGMGPGMMLRGLDLTEDQQKHIADIRDAQMRKAIQARADLRIAHLDLHRLMRAESPSQRAIEVQIDKIGAMRTALQKSRVAAMFRVRAVLTPDQLKKLHERHGMGPMLHQRQGRGMMQRPGSGGSSN